MSPDITAGQASRGTCQGGGGGQLVRATAKTAGPGQEARTAVLATKQSLFVSVQSHQEEWGLVVLHYLDICGRGPGGTYVEWGRGDCSFLFV